MGLIHASVNYVSGKVADLLIRIEALAGRIDENTSRLTSKADLVNGKVPADQLPGYVDDVIECADAEAFPLTGESGKLYIALDTNKVYRWSGTQYIQVSSEEITFDDALSADSVNAIQNQWLGKRLGATGVNSVQIGYNAKAGAGQGQSVDGGDNGLQVAVGDYANGSLNGTAVGCGAYGYSSGAAVGLDANGSGSGAAVGGIANGSSGGVAVGRSANGSSYGVAVGLSAKTNSVKGAVAVGHFASADSTTPIVIGGSQLASTAQITVSSNGVLKVGGKEVGGGGGDNNGCVYKVVDLGNSSIIPLRRETTIYKMAPDGAFGIAFYPPTLAANEVIVFWLWVIMGATAHQLTFPSTVTWLSEGSFAANTEAMLAFMSTDGGATWQANLQWEKAVTA